MSNHLSFRPFALSEAEQLADLITGNDWPFHVNRQPKREQVLKSIEDGNYTGDENRTFWICLDNQPDPVGIIVVEELDEREPVFDLRLSAAARYQGLGQKVLKWLADYVFQNTDKHKLDGHTLAGNQAMKKVFEKSGWVQEAYYRQGWPNLTGGYDDSLAYALLRSDWETGSVTAIPKQD